MQREIDPDQPRPTKTDRIISLVSPPIAIATINSNSGSKPRARLQRRLRRNNDVHLGDNKGQKEIGLYLVQQRQPTSNRPGRPLDRSRIGSGCSVLLSLGWPGLDRSYIIISKCSAHYITLQHQTTRNPHPGQDSIWAVVGPIRALQNKLSQQRRQASKRTSSAARLIRPSASPKATGRSKKRSHTFSRPTLPRRLQSNILPSRACFYAIAQRPILSGSPTSVSSQLFCRTKPLGRLPLG